nr:MAG TPA: hypothetical protein [Caudoviricetes sp.]
MAEWISDPQGREEIEKVTKELKLPVWKANHKGKFRDFWNELWDKIEDYILKLKGDTEKNSKGLNDRLISAVGKHDGDFPIANAVVGNVYYSELTKKYYKCKVAGPAPMPNGNFIDMSILENLNRLENLYKIEHTPDYDVLTILNRKFVVGSLETKGSTASKTLTANGFSFKNSIVMATAKKDNCSVAVIHSGDNLDFSTLDATSGNVQNGICKVDFFILLRN